MKILKRIHPNILLFGITSMFNDISTEMVTPILPFLITQLGGSGIAIGLIGGLKESFGNILKIFFGFLSDKTGNRKSFIFAGYINTALIKCGLVFARSWQMIFILTGIDRVGKGLRETPRDALIAHSSNGKTGLGFGIHRTLDTLGAIIGSLLVSLLLWHYKLTFSTILTIAAFLSFFSLIPLYWIQEDPEMTTEHHAGSMLLTIKSFSSPFKTFTAIATIFSFANFSYMFFILHTRDLFFTISPTAIPVALYVLFNICYTLCAAPLGILSDRIGRLKGIAAGYAVFTLTTFGFIFARSIHSCILLFILYGIALALIDVNQKAYISDEALVNYQATSLGSFAAATGIASLTGSIFSGFMWERISHESIFIFSTAMSCCALLLLFLFRKKFTANNV